MSEHLGKKWAKVPTNITVKIANSCTPGIDFNGSPKGAIISHYRRACHDRFYSISGAKFDVIKFEKFMTQSQMRYQHAFDATVSSLDMN